MRATLGASVLAAVLAAPCASAESLQESGRRLAQLHCSRCHVVGDFNRMGGISSTPSFQLIVRQLDDWRERFETFHVRLPHPSVIRIDGFAPASNDPPTTVQVHLKLEDVEALVAFAETFVE